MCSYSIKMKSSKILLMMFLASATAIIIDLDSICEMKDNVVAFGGDCPGEFLLKCVTLTILHAILCVM